MKLNRWLTSTVDAYLKEFGYSKNPIVYEVGSRDGHDGVELANRIREGERLVVDKNIVLFECNPPQIEVVNRNYPEATIITEAISNKKGTVEFMQIHGDNNMVGSSTMNTKRNDNWIKKTSTIKVKTRPLDDVIQELGHNEIDIMKIDLEGYTWEALESLGKLLRTVKVFHLETEVEGYARNKTNLDIAHYMEQKGYKCTSLEGEWLPDIQDQIWLRV